MLRLLSLRLSRLAPAAPRRLASSASSAAAAAAPPQRLVQALAANLRGGACDVEDLCVAFGVPPAARAPLARAAGLRALVVVKVGGDIITRELPTLVASLQSLLALGLFPVVVHGGGPQLNDELARAGVKPEYIGGHRVTDAATMRVAQRVFEAANAQLAAALEEAGVAAQPLVGGVFGAEVAPGSRLGLVGEVNRVFAERVEAAVAAGRVPVLTSLGVSAAGAALNINADVAARELAVALRPLKVVFISAGGGWREEGRLVESIDLARDFARMEARDYSGRQGTLLKLREVKLITDRLPAAASVTISSAAGLAAQLLPHRGPGTHVRRGVRLTRAGSAGALDSVRLEALLRACGAPPLPAPADVLAIFVSDEYSSCAVVVRPPAPASARGGAAAAAAPMPRLHAMACSPLAMAEGAEPALWARLREDFPALCWLAPPSRDTAEACAEVAARGAEHVPRAFPPLSVNRSAQHAAGGSIPLPPRQATGGAAAAAAAAPRGVAMWYGAGAERAVEVVAAVTAAAEAAEAAEAAAAAAFEMRAAAGGLAPAATLSGSSSSSPTSSSTSAAVTGPRDVRVGLLGARGFVGRELLRLIARHPRLQVVCASSRALAGQGVAEALGVPEAAAACAPGLDFVDVGPAQLRSGAHAPVDVWVLALPNGLAAAHAAAVDARAAEAGVRAPLLIDLSADMRFDACAPGGGWVYGLPERKGARAALRSARRIANPGCYATGAQVALMPLVAAATAVAGSGDSALPPPPFELDPTQRPTVFGVSGFSGAGTTPSDKNDPQRLRDNLLPYALVGHLHEREVATHCGLLARGGPAGAPGVAFMPHVAPFFQGISLTTSVQLRPRGAAALRVEDVQRHFERFYAGERLVRVLPAGAMPDVREHEERFAHGVTVGGFTLDAESGRLALVSCVDNLLKGAATQAVQNLNLALGFENEYEGIPTAGV